MFLTPRIILAAASAALLLSAAVSPSFAQQSGKTHVQGKEIPDKNEKEEYVAPERLIDYREDMRTFIQNIGNIMRKVNPNFVVMTMNGADLLTKREDGDEDRRVPAEIYLRSLDGIIQESLFYGNPNIDSATAEKDQAPLIKALDTAQKRSIKIFTLDYAKSSKKVSASYKKNQAKKYVSYAAPAQGIDLNHIARIPRRPFNENPSNVRSLKDVKNFAFIRDTTAYGTQAEFAMKLHDNNYDMLIIDPFHRKNRPLSRHTINTLQYKKLGARRLVLAYVNIGMAEAYRYYWKPHWREGQPTWIKSPKSGAPDKYYVEFWRPEWQRLIFNSPKAFIYGLVRDLGYDGVVLDGVEVYRFFEGDAE